MRSLEDVERFKGDMLFKLNGEEPTREQRQDMAFRTAAFEACLPRDFWEFDDANVKHNRKNYLDSIKPYIDQIKVAKIEGYGVALFGNSGTGKTSFASITMAAALRKRYSGYCTTSLRIEHDYRAARTDSARWRRLDFMLSSDFLMIDELGKEAILPSGESFGRAHIERILKDRADEKLPTIIVSNVPADELARIYGRSVESLLGGKFLIVTCEPGDYRPRVNAAMLAAMSTKAKAKAAG